MRTYLLCMMATFLLALHLPAGENLVENGEMKDEGPPTGLNLEDTPLAVVEVFKGNPLRGDAALKGPACLKFTFREVTANSKGFRFNQKIALEPSKTYRLRVKMHVPDRLEVLLGGRAHNLENLGKKAIQVDGRDWAYGCAVKGPTQGWQELECVLPAAGSGEKGAMPSDLGWVDLGVAISSMEPGVAYVGDVVMEEVK